MPVEIRRVDSAKIRRDFLRLPWLIYKGDEKWVLPILRAERKKVDINRKYSAFFVAYDRDNDPVGRVGVHYPVNAGKPGDCGFWWLFECVNDSAVADALLEMARNWFLTRGIKTMEGPVPPAPFQPDGAHVHWLPGTMPVGYGHLSGYCEALFRHSGMKKSRRRVSVFLSAGSGQPMEAPAMAKKAPLPENWKLVQHGRLEKGFMELLEKIPPEKQAGVFSRQSLERVRNHILLIRDSSFTAVLEKDGLPSAFCFLVYDLSEVGALLSDFWEAVYGLPRFLRNLALYLAEWAVLLFKVFVKPAEKFRNALLYTVPSGESAGEAERKFLSRFFTGGWNNPWGLKTVEIQYDTPQSSRARPAGAARGTDIWISPTAAGRTTSRKAAGRGPVRKKRKWAVKSRGGIRAKR